MNLSPSNSLSCRVGAASDKVAALERAGVVVSDSPAKIGALLLKVLSPLYPKG